MKMTESLNWNLRKANLMMKMIGNSMMRNYMMSWNWRTKNSKMKMKVNLMMRN
jgi:hypothetical protein